MASLKVMRVRVLAHMCVSECVSASEVGEMGEKTSLACVGEVE